MANYYSRLDELCEPTISVTSLALQEKIAAQNPHVSGLIQVPTKERFNQLMQQADEVIKDQRNVSYLAGYAGYSGYTGLGIQENIIRHAQHRRMLEYEDEVAKQQSNSNYFGMASSYRQNSSNFGNYTTATAGTSTSIMGYKPQHQQDKPVINITSRKTHQIEDLVVERKKLKLF